MAITAAGAKLASVSCGEPLAPNAYAAGQTLPAAPSAAASGMPVGTAVAIYVCSIVAVGAAAVFGTYKFIERRAAFPRYYQTFGAPPP